MSSEYSLDKITNSVVEVIFEKQLSSSEEPPIDEWSSLDYEVPDENIKRQKQAEGLYDPGSGEICTKYIPLSASSVLRHVYYNYPGIRDPGIEDALLKPEYKLQYPSDGCDLYLDLCKEIDVCPVRAFHRGLLQEKIDLRYYGINPKGFRPMAKALKTNSFVKILDLTDNWISNDGCFHLGEMLLDNVTLTEINLAGCRMGVKGAKMLLNNIHLNRTLRSLNLSKNELGDQGVELLANVFLKGFDLRKLNLSFNKITGRSFLVLSEAFEANNKLTHLDLSWNIISSSPKEFFVLCTLLSVNLSLEELNLSWNSLNGDHMGNAIKILLANPKVRLLNLSNNKLAGKAVKDIGMNLRKAKKLETLDLSYNPLSRDDAIKLLERLQERRVKLKRLLLDNVIVNEFFMTLREEILSCDFRSDTVITYGSVDKIFVCHPKDMREIIFDRCEAICKSKKKSIDIALLIQELYRDDPSPIGTRFFTRIVRDRGAQLDDDLIEQLANWFPGPKSQKMKLINLAAIVDYLKRKWPDRKLPPTPPPEPEPVPDLKKNKKGVKNKKTTKNKKK
ncbi:leucine-rich repeat-containing protein 74B-like [Plodia interpunctella]|uniref:leucine-rich repeat-containing protein 74B-like n=1 Tax=Plodia interpunctella TaxID=58824 RepID=UPI0023688A85|nr:leucine-rich repeat-containing protein 74B-like [Plodia interpunctella]